MFVAAAGPHNPGESEIVWNLASALLLFLLLVLVFLVVAAVVRAAIGHRSARGEVAALRTRVEELERRQVER